MGDRLRALFPGHERTLNGLLDAEAKVRSEAAQKQLVEKGKDDAGKVRELIELRAKEIAKTIAEMEKELKATQLSLFWPVEQRDQHTRTLDYLRTRLEQLKTERVSEPDAVRARYELRPPRMFPLGLVYILPRKLLEAK